MPGHGFGFRPTARRLQSVAALSAPPPGTLAFTSAAQSGLATLIMEGF